jgi:hypothetical protein
MIVGNSKWEITSRAHKRLLAAVREVEEIGVGLMAKQGGEG